MGIKTYCLLKYYGLNVKW